MLSHCPLPLALCVSPPRLKCVLSPLPFLVCWDVCRWARCGHRRDHCGITHNDHRASHQRAFWLCRVLCAATARMCPLSWWGITVDSRSSLSLRTPRARACRRTAGQEMDRQNVLWAGPLPHAQPDFPALPWQPRPCPPRPGLPTSSLRWWSPAWWRRRCPPWS